MKHEFYSCGSLPAMSRVSGDAPKTEHVSADKTSDKNTYDCKCLLHKLFSNSFISISKWIDTDYTAHVIKSAIGRTPRTR